MATGPSPTHSGGTGNLRDSRFTGSSGFVDVDLDTISSAPSVSDGRFVYQPCTATLSSNAIPPTVAAGTATKLEEVDVSNRNESFWPIVSRIFRDHLPRFKCCESPDLEEDEYRRGVDQIEMQELSGLRLNGAGEDVVESAQNVTPPATASKPHVPSCSIGPVMTVDCSTSSVENEVERMKASLGDVIKKVVIRNSPIESAMKILTEPLLTENVTSLVVSNCGITLRTLCSIVVGLKQLRNLSLEAKEILPEFILQDDFAKSRTDSSFFLDLATGVESRAQRLHTLHIKLPQIWQCSVACQGIGAVLQPNTLIELHIDSSLTSVLSPLLNSDLVRFEDEETWRDFVTLNIRKVFEQQSASLKYLSVACADNFPLEYMKLAETLKKGVNDIFKWCFVSTSGILKPFSPGDNLNDRQDGNGGFMIFPQLVNIHLDLPFVPVPMARNDAFRLPLNTLAEFLARNNDVHVVSVNGLRPVPGMENWIRNSFVTIPKYRMAIGCTYTSTTLGNNLPTYDDELSSLAIEIVADDTRRKVVDIIDPTGAESVPQPWRFSGMKVFHLINQLPALISYDIDRIAVKFSKLTKLVIEDNKLPEGVRNGGGGDVEGTSLRSLTDEDMQTIFRRLICLEYMHLDCNMLPVTDRGLTGISDSFWCRLTQKTKMYSFWFLCNLKYIYLRGLGTQVTDKSAVHAFSEDYSLMNLKELHVFAPGFTNHGREKIRRAYAGRIGFVMEV